MLLSWVRNDISKDEMMLIGSSHKIIPALKPTHDALEEAKKACVAFLQGANQINAIHARDAVLKAILELDSFALAHAKEGV